MMIRKLSIALIALTLMTAWPSTVRARQNGNSADDLRWRKMMGWNERVHGANTEANMEKLLASVPYAYYPYTNELEVFFDYSAAMKLLPSGSKPPHLSDLSHA